MKEITIRQANAHEIEWINSKYEDVGFVASNFDNEFIIIASIENQPAGLGRLVIIDEQNIELGGIYVFPNHRGLGIADKIVSYLCEHNPFKNTTIWCLPFENLQNFYYKFGFKNSNQRMAPLKVAEKHQWCNANEAYQKEVLLLSKNS
ncbi:GNAT family N-acetyltransferase [Tenacibaculum amylolyticum]|uniref:GNAT family N-acetyltransferase n=1 Tax=Tenacibaculum amylolyticum TaxID=104269 RepID=UPI003893EA68